ncbi:MAG: YihY/virulence factor BrkB family protein [Ruminococcaceae bacterium]|nr:YihY/virulence factor BrkB family protein [Oscillospiraceae bacterium]
MEFPKGGLIGKTAALLLRLRDMRIPNHAAHAGYFIVLAVFPALVLLLSLLRYTPWDARDLLALLEGFLPEALMGAAENLIVSTYAHTSTAVVSLSAIGTLWSASRGIYGLLMGLNAIYDVQENRSYVQTRLISMVYTFLFLLVLLATLVLGVFGDGLLSLLPPASGGLGILLTEVVDWGFFLMLALQTALFSAMFMMLPNRKNSFRESLPGAVLASAGWLIFTKLFSYYVEHFSSYSSVYGSVYAMALSMLWLYCCLSIVFYGGALNRLLMEKAEK